jgi:hypothetical protein
MPELTLVATWMRLLWSRLQVSAHDDRGSVTTEQVIITAILAALALAAGAIIVVKVIDRANSVPTQ